MHDRLLFAASAVARFVMVVVAFGLAVGSIGLASVRGFCPEVDEQGPAGDAPATEQTPTGQTPAEDGGGACPGEMQRCLPPLWSSVLILGEPACHEQAPARLRSTLVPSFVGSTILFAGAWWLRPSRLEAKRREETPTST